MLLSRSLLSPAFFSPLLTSCPSSLSCPCLPSDSWPTPRRRILVRTNDHRRVLVGNLYLVHRCC